MELFNISLDELSIESINRIINIVTNCCDDTENSIISLSSDGKLIHLDQKKVQYNEQDN